MDEKTRRILEMGQRALEFCREHPDSSPEYVATLARLEALLARARELEIQEEKERKLSRISRRLDPEGKIIPFKQRSKGGPTDPAA
jgi:hypothetical protein